MPHYLKFGQVPKKRFTSFRKPDGKIYYEHLINSEGFSAESSLLYRINAPSRFTRTETMEPLPLSSGGNPIARNLLFKAEKLGKGGDFVDSRVPALFSGEELIFNVAKPTKSMERFFCNVTADELVLVTKGSGKLQSIFGDIPFEPLDLIRVPRGDLVRWQLDAGPHEMIVVESRSAIRPPKGFLRPNGQFDDHASYHERDLKTPVFREPVDIQGEHPVVMKVGAQLTCAYLDHHPFDVVGWDGCFYPFALNMRDYEPLTGRIFLLPDQYQVFGTDQAMFVAITPRRGPDIDDPSPAQAFHQNLEYDEVLFRFSGSSGPTEPSAGTFTLHPRGIMHGPKPGFENTPIHTHAEAWALMMDTRLTLHPTVEAIASLDEGYAKTWVTNQLTPGKMQVA